jgi:hypothetical protein
MLARKIVSIHPAVVLVFWIALALASPILVTILDDTTSMLVVNLVSLAMGACWCGWLWAIRTAALDETSDAETPRRPWLALLPLLAFLPFTALPPQAQTGGLLAVVANVLGLFVVASCGFLLWKTAEALERMVGQGKTPPKMQIFSTTVLLAMVYVAPFVVARRFKARAKFDEPLAA